MTISYSNLKSMDQKAQDAAQAAQVGAFVANAERVNADDVFTRERGMKENTRGEMVPGWVRILREGVDLAGMVVHCSPMRARGAGRNLMKNRDKRAMHPVTRGVDFAGYAEQNRRNAENYNAARWDALEALLSTPSPEMTSYDAHKEAITYAVTSTITDAEAGTAYTTM